MDRVPLLTLFSLVLASCGCPEDESFTEYEILTNEELEPYLKADGTLDEEMCDVMCREFAEVEADRCELTLREEANDKNEISCSGTYRPFCTGRRPAGLASSGRAAGPAPLARWLAEAAHLEAASVPAFERLAADLRALGAPSSLVAAAKDAADDERRHAALMARLARAQGGYPAPVELAPAAPAELESLALDNAVEGCVRETWGAMLALHQARRAATPALRRAFGVIARDEARHAELAHSLAGWLEPRLQSSARARLRAAQASALAALRRTAGAELPDATARHLGLPSRARSLALLARLAPRLWPDASRPEPVAAAPA